MRKFLYAVIAGVMASVGCTNNQSTPSECCQKCENPVIENIMTRRSIRSYKEQAVPRELLDKVTECGIYAANAMNAQQWEVRIVDSKEWIDKTTQAYKESVKGTPGEKATADPSFKNMFRNAPAVIFIGHKPGMFTQVDCGLMAGNMMLAAKSLGLGTVCMASPVMFFKQPAGEPYLKSLNFSDGYEPLLCIGIGYADEEPTARPRNKEVIKYVE
jgi:nitroreductase